MSELIEAIMNAAEKLQEVTGRPPVKLRLSPEAWMRLQRECDRGQLIAPVARGATPRFNGLQVEVDYEIVGILKVHVE